MKKQIYQFERKVFSKMKEREREREKEKIEEKKVYDDNKDAEGSNPGHSELNGPMR